jgi:hypothetical protein
MAKRESKKISGELRDMLLKINEEDITASFIYDLFGEYDGVTKCNPYDLIDIPPGYYGPENKKNKNTFTTTVGLWIYNKWFIEKQLFDVFGYINKTINKKQHGKMNQTLTYELMEDRIDTETLKRYLMKTQLIMQFVTVISPNYNESLLTLTKVVDKKKNALIKEHKKELEAGDTVVAQQIEDELLAYAQEVMKDDPAMDIFLSGARSDINNNFKNLFIWKGATRDPNPDAKQEFRIATSNYTDGIKRDEYALYCNSGIEGAYSRGKKTEHGGYLENLATAAYQDIILDEPGTDCGTDRYVEDILTEDNLNRYIYNNIIGSNGKLTELNSKNANKYMGKKIKMRMAYLCPHERPCAACAGNFFYKLGIKNVGLTLMQVFSIYKNKSMKAFHDSTVQLCEIDTMKAFGLKD